MNELAVSYQAQHNGGTGVAPASPAQMFDKDLLDNVWYLAENAAKSGLFPGISNAQQAFSLMMICHSEGLHPMQALRRYHIIEGRPSMRADAIQAEFQARGGEIEILRCDAVEARAIFRHPKLQPKGFEFSVTYAQFTGMMMGKYGVKDNWKHSPADMLWARLVSKGVRKVYPGIVAGIYTPEEVEDMAAPALSAETVARLSAPPAPALAAPADVDLPGFAGPGFDDRPYVRVVEEAVEAQDRAIAEAYGPLVAAGGRPYPPVDVHALHKHVLFSAINLGHAEGPPPSTRAKAIGALSLVYKAERDWVRREVAAYLAKEAESAESTLRDAMEAADSALDPDDYGGVVPAEVA